MHTNTVSVIGNSKLGHDGLADDAQSLGGAFADKNYAVVVPGRLDGISGAFAAGMLSYQPHEKSKLFNVVADPATLFDSSKPLNEVELIVQSQNHRTIVDGADNVKESLVRRSDISVLLSGGGLEELNQAVHLARMGTPLVVVNDAGYYSGLKSQIEQIKINAHQHDLQENVGEHIHFADDIEHAAAIVQAYESAGTPEYDYMQRWRTAQRDEKILQNSREGHMTGFKTVGNAHILSPETGLVALDRATSAMVEPNSLPLVIDNAGGYHNGLIEQFEDMVENGAEKMHFHDRYKIVKNAGDALALARDLDASARAPQASDLNFDHS